MPTGCEDGAMSRWWSKFRPAVFLMTLLGTLLLGHHSSASAQRVTAAQVAAAVAASPNASAALQSYAGAVGNLAMFESGGQLGIYNGSCCYGVLQMNTSNINAIRPSVSVQQFQQWPLQAQVDAWSRVMSQALATYPVRTLAAMGTFDGRPVTPELLLACVQLGTGNCQTMIRSGRCSGFADINRTTICSMADRIRGGASPTPVPNPNPNPDPGVPATRAPASYIGNCITDGHGHCLSMSAAMEQGFMEGSGRSMGDVRNMIQSLTVGVTLLICAWLGMGLWREFTTGRIATADLVMGGRNVLMIVAMIFVVMTVV